MGFMIITAGNVSTFPVIFCQLLSIPILLVRVKNKYFMIFNLI